MKKFKVHTFIYFLITILFLEIVYKVSAFGHFFNIGLLYMLFFSIPIALLLSFLTSLFSDKVNAILRWSLTILLSVFFIFQYIFITLFSVPFSFSTITLASQALDFIDSISRILLPHSGIMLLAFMPLVFLIVLRKNVIFVSFKQEKKYILLALIITQVLATLALIPGKKELYSSYQLYYNVDAPSQINDRFGLLTGTRIDIKRVIFKLKENIIIDIDDSDDEEPNTPEEIKYNILDIDFESLINDTTDATLKQMHSYFANEDATKQNEYTGIFKDKNLIFVIAEGFNQIAVSKDLTPTLYKLSNESFIFENFYTPVMLSTVGGEMQALLGLIPFQETINLWPVNKPIFPYAIGNSFADAGYIAKAYHNWTYTYYNRNKTRSTIGFSDYLGCGNGLEKLMNCKNWPTSDVDLIEAISPQIIGTGKNQVTYILTVSGHANYSWGANYISRKNKSLVNDLPYSEEIKGYLASQIELDKALELLIKNLEEAGELDDTVIALVGDHYPYFFSVEQINELSTYKRDKTFEVNRSNFILWNSKMSKTVVEKIGSQIDVLPTILNLFGIEYDSRLIIGKDLLSDTPGLAIFSDRSWISDLGRYKSGKFTPNSEVEIADDYVSKMNKIVANKFSMSKLIMIHDYYKKLLGS